MSPGASHLSYPYQRTLGATFTLSALGSRLFRGSSRLSALQMYHLPCPSQAPLCRNDLTAMAPRSPRLRRPTPQLNGAFPLTPKKAFDSLPHELSWSKGGLAHPPHPMGPSLALGSYTHPVALFGGVRKPLVLPLATTVPSPSGGSRGSRRGPQTRPQRGMLAGRCQAITLIAALRPSLHYIRMINAVP